MVFGLCCAVVVCALLVGGGTHSGFYGDVAVQLLSIPLLIAALWPAFEDDGTRKKKARMALAICLTCAIVVLIQVFPLPFDVWSDRRALFPDGDNTRFAGAHPGWSTLSVTPQATWVAAASLLVPLSVFGSVVQLDLRQRMVLCWVLLGVGATSLVLGFLQVAQGPDSPLRFYEFSNPTEPVGFFANRNHFAAFLNVTLVLSALWLSQRMESSLDRRGLNSSSFLWFAAAAAFFVAVVAGLAMARSRAGAFLAIVTLAAIVLMILAHGRSHHTRAPPHRKTRMGRVSLAVALFAVVFTLQFGLGGLLARFEGDPTDDLRIPLNRTTFETAFKALPFGTGLGSFVPVYATVEKSQDVVEGFANRAHNDLAELFLETGLIGASLVILFLVWLGRRFYAVWGRAKLDEDPRQSMLQRASTLIVALLLAHSLVDYPLRTTALGAVFGVFCGFLAAPVPAPFRDGPKPRQQRDVGQPPKAVAQPAEPWNADIQWPISWQKKYTTPERD